MSINDFVTTALVTTISKVLSEDEANKDIKTINIMVPA